MQFLSAATSIIPVIALMVAYLTTERLSNVDVLLVALLAQLSIVVPTMFGNEAQRQMYVANLTGTRRTWATMNVLGTVGVGVCTLFRADVSATMLCLTLVFAGQLMLELSHWGALRVARTRH